MSLTFMISDQHIPHALTLHVGKKAAAVTLYERDLTPSPDETTEIR